MVQGWTSWDRASRSQSRLRPRQTALLDAKMTSSSHSMTEEKRLYQRIVAKLDYLAHHLLDLKYATSCLASAVSV